MQAREALGHRALPRVLPGLSRILRAATWRHHWVKFSARCDLSRRILLLCCCVGRARRDGGRARRQPVGRVCRAQAAVLAEPGDRGTEGRHDQSDPAALPSRDEQREQQRKPPAPPNLRPQRPLVFRCALIQLTLDLRIAFAIVRTRARGDG